MDGFVVSTVYIFGCRADGIVFFFFTFLTDSAIQLLKALNVNIKIRSFV